ncbi:MAG TPA: M28 family peptidase [Bacteroidales bacterium]|nr:M28 family peptidase [Bacteroidales bacterium]HRZ50115.1 M28 family peptidase [Bacteroidales bacterium]
MGWFVQTRRVAAALILLIIIDLQVYSQDTAYVKRVVEILTSDSLAGRGYQHNGDRKAAAFIASEFRKAGLESIGSCYHQGVIFPVNNITGEVVCRIGDRTLKAGTEVLVSARSKGVSREYRLVWLSHKTAKNPARLRRFFWRDLRNSLVVADPAIAADKDLKELYQALFRGQISGVAGMVRIMDKPYWHISDSGIETDYLVVTVKSGILDHRSRKMYVSFTNHFEPAYHSQNVAAMVRGTLHPDSFIVFTAHYDHLGRMGDVMFPGANDNGSGTAMVLDLARHYSHNPHPYSVAFIAFTGEEAGLLGSTQYTERPLFPLQNIAVLFNFDMVASGSDGITVVNGSVHPGDFNLLDSLNAAHSLLKQVAVRGESPNSDHHPFHARGVKAFFIYTMGSEQTEYHTINDRSPVPFTAYIPFFSLITRYAELYH